ncbi:hypothetical protein [Mesonia sp.]|uniref:hypothetical protein n=1 Tax=Mesonia sp. TaxID=1960830 RepID=UPI003F966883
MLKSLVVSVLLLIPLLGFSQINDSLAKPMISLDKTKLLKNIDITFDMRMGLRAYTFRGGDHYYNGVQF